MGMNVQELPAKRVRELYKGDNLYLILTFMDGELYDIAPSISGERINKDQGALSNLDALCAMTSRCLREYDKEYIAGILLECSRGPSTLPCILANAILEHGNETNLRDV